MARRDSLDARAVAIVVGLCVLWGVQQVAIKAALAGGLPAFWQVAARSVVAAILIAAYSLARGDRLAGMRASWRPGLVIAALFAAEFLCLYPGLQRTTASRGVVFLYTAPFFTALVAHVALPGERLDRRRWLGLAVAFAGVALAFADGLLSGGGSVPGDGLCLAAGALWGVTTPIVKLARSLRDAGPARVLLWQLAGSAPALLLAAAVFEPGFDPAAATAPAWAGFAYQTFVVASASYLAWFWLLGAYPASQVAGFTFLTPVFGILAGTVLLGERPGWPVLAGLVAVAAGLRLLNAPRAVAPLGAGR